MELSSKRMKMDDLSIQKKADILAGESYIIKILPGVKSQAVFMNK